MQFPIMIGLHRSRFLDSFLVLSAVLASGAALVFPRSTEIQVVILLAVWLVVISAWRQLSPRIAAIRLERSGEISLLPLSGEEFFLVGILPGATVHPWLTVIRLKTSAGLAYTLIVTVDSLNEADFRHLRVFLRWRGDFNDPDGDA